MVAPIKRWHKLSTKYRTIVQFNILYGRSNHTIHVVDATQRTAVPEKFPFPSEEKVPYAVSLIYKGD
ncbi:hypothetical protein EYZ11_006696 [Aspergillus tanneri]|uniref:Uncharacterized protein n=1 Tax=Aspergillus tanneri TaxID=1220188 RepID=A0A4V6RQT3_9EURO|nr:hypothetical protein EYZ11_006696 [Aspergillus tanneri]